MKHVLGRALLVMMVILLAVGSIAPAALAAESMVASSADDGSVISNATNTLTMYVGMKDQLTIKRDGVKQSPTLYKWKSSKSSVVSVNKYGNITAKKAGTAIIYATRKSDGSQLSLKVTVKRNKVDNINSRPSASVVEYKNIGVRLKSVEILSGSRILVEYYLMCNFPSNWTLTKIKSLQDAINLFNRSTGKFEKTIVGDDRQVWATSIKGFTARGGKFVQVIKVTFTGSRVHGSNVILSNYKINDSDNVQINYNYRD